MKPTHPFLLFLALSLSTIAVALPTKINTSTPATHLISPLPKAPNVPPVGPPSQLTQNTLYANQQSTPKTPTMRPAPSPPGTMTPLALTDNDDADVPDAEAEVWRSQIAGDGGNGGRSAGTGAAAAAGRGVKRPGSVNPQLEGAAAGAATNLKKKGKGEELPEGR
ncbi:hypothetical protein EX30DRAFT_352267 [Ascodesmis nigricans]|uniref:Uncharacterized protein n=1 Tax=Ascodesmis nigricans TaxID=341454 RepID=A0A4S2MJB0_9PEZI|nr:hypothetical protein EX30DRAFT_352267 [Ascodesmis nigricans]